MGMSQKDEHLKKIEEDCKYFCVCCEGHNGYVPCYRMRQKFDDFDKDRCREYNGWKRMDMRLMENDGKTRRS